MKNPIKTVGILPNRNKPIAIEKAIEVSKNLSEKGIIVKAPDFLKDFHGASQDIYSESDAIIVFGGDGTILSAARKACLKNIPILSINTGKIGYLTSLEQDDQFDVDTFLSGDFTIEHRMMLECQIIRNGNVVFNDIALNEFVVSKGSLSRMLNFRMFCGPADYMEYRADAMIVSTPTGSTAYSMSAGGAIIDPSLECIQVTPICPYSLSGAKHMIFSPSSTIKINVTETNNSEAWLTGDGRASYHLESGDDIIIKKSDKETSLIKLNDKTFCDILVSKLKA